MPSREKRLAPQARAKRAAQPSQAELYVLCEDFVNKSDALRRATPVADKAGPVRGDSFKITMCKSFPTMVQHIEFNVPERHTSESCRVRMTARDARTLANEILRWVSEYERDHGVSPEKGPNDD